VAIRGLYALGFDHVEVGTVTAIAQPGNPKPRLFRLPEDQALINRMGFNNVGAQIVAARLAALRHWAERYRHRCQYRQKPNHSFVGGNRRFMWLVPRFLAPFADYLVVNVSSPNTPGLRGLQDVASLRPLLAAVAAVAGDTPLLVKISPDLDDRAVSDIASVVLDLDLAGIIATNTTTARDGLSTPPDVLARMGAGDFPVSH